MARYFASGQQTLTSVADSAVTVSSNTATVQRNWIYEINMGNVGTPADLVSIYLIGKITANNSANATAVTPTLLDEADRAAQAQAFSNHTGEPTYQAGTVALNIPTQGDLLRVPLNHRATYRWVAPPGGEFVCPAVTGDGVGGKSGHASATTDYMIGMHWIE
jgi:hypothetical protein